MSRYAFGVILTLLAAGSGAAARAYSAATEPEAAPLGAVESSGVAAAAGAVPEGAGAPSPVPEPGGATVLPWTLVGAMAGPSIPAQEQDEGPPYNGQFTFIRLQYGDAGADMRNMSFRRRGRGGGGPTWRHDYPRAERNFAKIVEATTFIDTYSEGNAGRILTLDDPELFKYPIASIIEVGYWNPSDTEIANLRAYLLKGGFLIVDDTRQDRGYEYQNFAAHMKRALPEYDIQQMPHDHKIFDSFFYIEDPSSLVPPYGRNVPQYLGIFEDNDPVNGRIMVMINFNQDLQEYWEFSDQGYYPIDLSNEAYQFGVNYLIYAYTH